MSAADGFEYGVRDLASASVIGSAEGGFLPALHQGIAPPIGVVHDKGSVFGEHKAVRSAA